MSSYADLRLEAGWTYGTQLLGESYSIVVRRGLKASGVTDDLDPATLTAVLRGGESVNPVTNDDVRPERPWRLRARLDGGPGWVTLCSGKIQRAQVQYDKSDATTPNAYRLTLTGVDVVRELAAAPSEVAVSGTLTQRVAAVMDPTGLPYVVDDPLPAGPSSPITTDARDAVAQLRLVRDTAHALMYINRDGVLVAVSDHARPRAASAPDWQATDDSSAPGIRYNQLTPAYDTDALVNLLTIKLLDGAENPETTHEDPDSRATWGDHPQAVTVNGGVPETHADLWFASRLDPDLIPEKLEFIVQERDPLSRPPEGRSAHLAAAVGVELYDSVRVTRTGVPTADLLVREVTHLITPARWTVELGLRVPEVLATRWTDVPADLTWADVPAGLTWREAVNWRPYLDEGA